MITSTQQAPRRGLLALALALALALLSAGCPRKTETTRGAENKSGADGKTGAEGSGEHEHESLPKVVHLSADVFRNAKLEVAPATKEILGASVVLPGEIVADPDRSARISSTLAGRVEDVRFRDGAVVKKGDVMVVVRVPDLGKVRGAYTATTGKAKAARANADRLKDLVENRLASQQAFLDAEAEAQSLDAEAKALAEQLAAVGAGGGGGTGVLLNLRAPISGVVMKRDAVVGQPVSADQTLGSIADLSEAWFLGRVFEKDLGRLHEGARAEVVLNAYPTEHFDGAIEVLGQQIDPVARTLTARIRITNRRGLLRIGLFGGARVESGDERPKERVLVVPRSAITEVAGKPVVFVRTGEETFELHEIVTGESAVGKVQVLSGLKEGESVVTHGVFTLKSIVLKGTFGEED
jgi:cobalt-zinc-cadmium efflux system membrane fusion protein